MLQDTALVVGCMPGASLDGPPDGNRLRGQMRVKLGPIVAAFAGEAELLMDDAACTGAIRGQGLDRRNNSRARADVGFSLAADGEGTRVDINVDFTLTGTLAQFSRGAIVQEIARRLTSEFATNLTTAMTAGAAVPAADVPASVTAPAPARAVNLLGLLRSMIGAWFRRRLGRLLGRADAPQ